MNVQSKISIFFFQTTYEKRNNDYKNAILININQYL